MLFQPSYLYPYLSDIDATEENTFQCYINAEGGTTVTGYVLTIHDLSGTQIYSDAQTLDTPLYAQQTLTITIPTTSGLINGYDYTWNIKLIETKADIWVAFGSIQEGDNTTTQLILRKNWLVSSGDWIVINNQKVKMTSYDSTTGIAVLATELTAVPAVGTTYNIYSDNVQSSDYLFFCRTTPTLSINDFPSEIDNKTYTFTGNYSQEQGVNYKYFIWSIYDELGNQLATTGEVTTGDIEYTFDGFINEETYGVGLMLKNQDDTIISTPIKYFTVKYQQPEVYSAPNSELDCDKNAIRVYWTPLLINTGIAEGTSDIKYNYLYNVPYETGVSVHIHDGADIMWNIGSEGSPIYFNYESTTYIHWSTTNSSFAGLVYRQEATSYELVAISSVAPTTATKGDRYYNTTTGYIYTAIEDNIWGSTGEKALTTIMYSLTSTGDRYIYNGTTLEPTNYPLPIYEVSYSQGVFYYTIINGSTNKTGSVKVADIDTLWLLQPEGSDPEQAYAWIDSGQRWDDSLLWTESTVSYIDKFWFKITLLPTEIRVLAIPKTTN